MEISYSGLYTMNPEKARGKSKKAIPRFFIPELFSTRHLGQSQAEREDRTSVCACGDKICH